MHNNSGQPSGRIVNRWHVLILITTGRTLMALQFGAVAPLIPLMVKDLEASYAQVGLLIGLYMLPGVFLSLPSGVIGGLFKERYSISMAGLLLALGGVLVGLAPHFHYPFGWAYAGRIIAGVGASIFTVMASKIVASRFPHNEQGTAMGILVPGWPAGIGLGLLSLGWVAGEISWQGVYYLIASLSLIFAIAVFLFLGEAPIAASSHSGQENPPPQSAARGGIFTRIGWRLTGREAVLVGIIASIWVLVNCNFNVVTTYFPTWFVEGGMDISKAGALTSIAAFIGIIAVPAGGLLVDRLNAPGWILGISVLAGAVFLYVILRGANPLLFLVLWGFIGALGVSGIFATIARITSEAARGTAFGVFYTIFYLGMLAFPPFAGSIIDYTGEVVSAIYLGIILVVLIPVLQILFALASPRSTPDISHAMNKT